jgi:hypothetical protein
LDQYRRRDAVAGWVIFLVGFNVASDFVGVLARWDKN